MFVYIVATILSVSFAYLANKSINKNEIQISCNETSEKVWNLDAKVFLFLSFLSLYLVSAVRYRVGTDYATTYRELFYITYNLGYELNFRAESLFYLMQYIITFFTNDYVVTFVFSSFLICFFTFIGFKNTSESIHYSVLLWIISGAYFWSFNGVRQAIAMAIFIYSIKFIQKQKLVPYILCILLATGFHRTALLYMPVYFIARIKLKLFVVMILSVMTVIIDYAFRYFVIWLARNMAIFELFYTRYFSVDSFDQSSIFTTLINILFLLLFSIIIKISDKRDMKHQMWINIQFLAVIFSLLITVIPWVSRVSRLYSTALPLAIPSMVALIPKQKDRFFVNAIIITCFFVYTIVTFFILGFHDVVPYRTIFSR